MNIEKSTMMQGCLQDVISPEEINVFSEINNGTEKFSKELDVFMKKIVDDPERMKALPEQFRKELNWRYSKAHMTKSTHQGFVLGSSPLVTKDGISFMIHSGRGQNDFFNIAAVEGGVSKSFETAEFVSDPGKHGGFYFCPATSHGKYTAVAQYNKIFLFSEDKHIKQFSCMPENGFINEHYIALELKIFDHYLFAKVYDKSGFADDEQCLVVYDINSSQLIKTVPLQAPPLNCIGEIGCTDYFDLHPKMCFGKEYVVDFCCGEWKDATEFGQEDESEGEIFCELEKYHYTLNAYPLANFFEGTDPQVYESKEVFSHPSIFAEDNHFIVISRGDSLNKVKIDKVEIIDGKFKVTNLANVWEGEEYLYETVDYKNKKVACVYRSKTDLKTCRIATYDLKTDVECRFPKFPFSNNNMSKRMGDNILFQPKVVIEEIEPKIHYYQMITRSSDEKLILDHTCLDYTKGDLGNQENEFLNNVDMEYSEKDPDPGYIKNKGIAYSFIHDYKREG